MKNIIRLFGLMLFCLILVYTTNGFAGDWPQWRGLQRDGKSTDTNLLKEWPVAGPALIWKASGLGKGLSSVSVVGNRIYIMGDQADGNYMMALSSDDGKIFWSTKVGQAGEVGSGRNSFPGPRCTPTVAGNQIFAVDQFGEFICVNSTTGKEQWRKNFVKDFGGSPPRWGFAESPLVDGNRVMITPGGNKGAMVALDIKTGNLIWQSREFTDAAHYSSIVYAKIDGLAQYIQLTAENVVGMSPKDGTVLWKAPRRGRTAVIPTPVVDGNYVYVTSGYNVGSHLFKITSNSGSFLAEQVYANGDMANQHGGVVKVGDYLYGYSDSKGLVCQNFLSGEIVWAEREKIKKGAVSYADDMLYFREERTGTMILVEATPSGYSEISRFDQPDRSEEMAWPHPVIANGKLFLRDQDRLFCFDLNGK